MLLGPSTEKVSLVKTNSAFLAVSCICLPDISLVPDAFTEGLVFSFPKFIFSTEQVFTAWSSNVFKIK